jgi:hypothetical protein
MNIQPFVCEMQIARIPTSRPQDARPMHYGVIDIMGIEYLFVNIPSVFTFDVGHHHL